MFMKSYDVFSYTISMPNPKFVNGTKTWWNSSAIVMTRLFCHNSALNTPFRTRRNQSLVPLADRSPKYLSLALRSYSLIPSPLTTACDTHYPSSLSPSLVVPGFPLRLEWMKHLRTATGLAHIEYQVVGRST
jgi:hypothetical protein